MAKKCFKNSQCASNFCDDGKCNDKPRFGDPCKPGYCPNDQVCDWYTGRCNFHFVVEARDKQNINDQCIVDSDCPSNMFCKYSKCKLSGGAGARCTFDSECQDGLSCEKNKCVPRCLTDVDCSFGDVCTHTLFMKEYKLCEPKKKEVKGPVMDNPVPRPVPVPRPHETQKPDSYYGHTSPSYSSSVIPLIVLLGLITIGVLIIILVLWLLTRRTKRKRMMQADQPSQAHFGPSQPPAAQYYIQQQPQPQPQQPQPQSQSQSQPQQQHGMLPVQAGSPYPAMYSSYPSFEMGSSAGSSPQNYQGYQPPSYEEVSASSNPSSPVEKH